MTVTSLASYKEVKKKEEEKAHRRWKRSLPRYLGGRVYCALTRTYNCKRCISQIDYLEQYRRDRFVHDYYDQNGKRKSYFWYERSHWPMCYGPSKDEEQERMRKEAERFEREEAERQKRVA